MSAVSKMLGTRMTYVCGTLVLLLLGCHRADGQTLKKVAEIDLPGAAGKRFDYLTIDYSHGYLLSAHLAANTVDPCSGVPLPDGSPVPSGRMLISHAATSDSEIGLPRCGASCATARTYPSETIVSAIEKRALRVDMRDLPGSTDRPRRAMTSARVGCTLPASSHARLCSTAGPPSHFHGSRKRVNAFGSTGSCSATSAHVFPPSAVTITFAMRPLAEYATPDTS